MKIGLISNSHDHIDNIRKAAQTFKDRGVSLVIHAGDIVSPPALKPFQGMRIAGIFGNNDGEEAGIR
jgi:predicted phosphodiesterase